jgi:hypothetical protein
MVSTIAAEFAVVHCPGSGTHARARIVVVGGNGVRGRPDTLDERPASDLDAEDAL